jgi:glycosyltransferase involved in cell wall biosynthesis
VTLALTAVDAAALRRLALAAGFPGARVIEVPAPFSAELAPGPPDLDGEPPVVMMGSRGWRPNEDAVEWFRGEVWPEVRRAVPGARLHVFGFGDGAAPVALRPSAARGERPLGGDAGSSGISWHSAPAESAVAFARGSVQVVPLRFGSGVRMKILEAWARGVPVVATAEGASGLEASDGAELLVARDGAGFAAAIRRLCDEPALAAALVRGGRAALRRRHDPVAVARRLLAAYAEAAS